jgi:hypothetical protein
VAAVTAPTIQEVEISDLREGDEIEWFCKEYELETRGVVERTINREEVSVRRDGYGRWYLYPYNSRDIRRIGGIPEGTVILRLAKCQICGESTGKTYPQGTPVPADAIRCEHCEKVAGVPHYSYEDVQPFMGTIRGRQHGVRPRRRGDRQAIHLDVSDDDWFPVEESLDWDEDDGLPIEPAGYDRHCECQACRDYRYYI